MTTGRFLIYGATGYTGKLVARTARSQGLRPILAGRDAARTQAVAAGHGFEWRAFGLAEAAKLDAALNEVDAVLHLAGPFSATSRPMADACLRTGRHYLDITGEIDVFEALAARSTEAKARGVMLLPGAGFDVVPSDCLAAHVKRRLPDATRLFLAIGGLGRLSRGTAKTSVEGIALGTRARRGGRVVRLPDTPRASADFGDGPVPTVALSWGDIATAWHSTQIPDIDVHFQSSRQIEQMTKLGPLARFMLSTRLGQHIAKAAVDRQPEGPTDAERAADHAVLVAEASNAKGDTVRSRLRTPEGYTLTAMTATEIVRRVLAGDFKPGFQTPSLAYGADFVMRFEGVTREDLKG
ncbi:MAG: saccharopine dehydrogenase NADP-binding domain-containing protein [Burkholderiales bacterium]|nr:saccharopine dehydrogenase NADP-binding domain-containing protein [Burkholderiales bacterium]